MQSSELCALVLGSAARDLPRVPDAPLVGARAMAPLRAADAVDETGAVRKLLLPVERPLSIVLDGQERVTLMTLGAAPEWLALGYLRNQRLIDLVSEVRSVAVDWHRSRAEVTMRESRHGAGPGGAPAMPGCALGTAFAESVGAHFGEDLGEDLGEAPHRPRKRGLLGALAAPVPKGIRRSEIMAILEIMREHDAIHRAAGSVHSCALLRAAELWVAVEDVSRHNGIDTLTGFMMLHGIDGADKIIFSTGRLTAEMVMKAAHNRVSVMISRNGTTVLGYELAATLGMTLIGRAAKGRYVCYVGAERIDLAG